MTGKKFRRATAFLSETTPMTMRDFIKKNRARLDEIINGALNHVPRTASCSCPKSGTDHYHNDKKSLDDEGRRQWILADEGLYNWARSEGVPI
jgi:hypothetical protein